MKSSFTRTCQLIYITYRYELRRFSSVVATCKHFYALNHQFRLPYEISISKIDDSRGNQNGFDMIQKMKWYNIIDTSYNLIDYILLLVYNDWRRENVVTWLNPFYFANGLEIFNIAEYLFSKIDNKMCIVIENKVLRCSKLEISFIFADS